MLIVSRLFIKKTSGHPVTQVKNLNVTAEGIVSAVKSNPQRQILILPENTITEFKLNPGTLKENIILSGSSFELIKSGDVLKIADVNIRITYQCEPCNFVSSWAKPKDLINKRGILGTILNPGTIELNDQASINPEISFEPIPYQIKDRIVWYLDKQTQPILAADLVFNVGLSLSYCRTLPNLINKLDLKYKSLVIYKTDVNANFVNLSFRQ